LIQNQDRHPKHVYKKSKGLLTEEQIEKATELYGENLFELPQPTFIELMQAQLASPIVIFQLFCAFLWALDTYWKYTMFTL